MRARRRSAVPLLAALGIAPACSWSQFNDYKNNTPVFAFTNKAYGATVTIATSGDHVAILATAGKPTDGVRFYDLKDGRADPTGTPLTGQSICALQSDKIPQGLACASAAQIQGLTTPTPGKWCFAIGYGRTSALSATAHGPVVFCTESSATEVLLGAPKVADAPKLTGAFDRKNEAEISRLPQVTFAARPSRIDGASLLMGDPADGAAFVYRQIAERKPGLTLKPNGRGDGFGSAVAVGNDGGRELFLVAAPGAGVVYAFRVEGDAPTQVGCLDGGVAGFGATMTTGDVGTGQAEVLVAAPDGVRVHSMADVLRQATCGDKAVPRVVLRCVEGRGASDCGAARFGASIAVGDLVGDRRPYIAVGAPDATVEGNARAGAVFLYSPGGGGDVSVKDVRYLGRPEGGAGFGSSVAIGDVGGQSTLAVGAAGVGNAYAVWCTGLPGTPATPRCRR